MYRLFTAYFAGVAWAGFLSDLDRKNWVVLLKEETTHTLKGFSTLLLGQTQFAGEPMSVVYSGDTIIDPSIWSSAILPKAWIAAINYLHRRYAPGKLYWLLICSGFRTYRFLPTFWQTFYPRYDRETPAAVAALITFLAESYYQNCYEPATGIVRFSNPQVLRSQLLEIPSGRQTNPHVRFFEQQNPGYRHGDELVCLTEICPDNLTRAGQRMWQAESSLEFVEEAIVA
jgi:hypothetical protein